MVKRKASAPQRWAANIREEQARAVGRHRPGTSSPPAETDAIKLNCVLQKRSKADDPVTDPVLRGFLDDCLFHLCIRCRVSADNIILLGTVSVIISTSNIPSTDQFWLYVSELPDRSMIYFETTEAVSYFTVSSTLDTILYKALLWRHFVISLLDFCEVSRTLTLAVYLQKEGLQGATVHAEGGWREGSSEMQVVMAHFFGMAGPNIKEEEDQEKQEEDEKERIQHNQLDVASLYCSVMARHIPPSVCVPYTQHPSLLPTLRPYQQAAVQWMLAREVPTAANEDELHPLYTELVTPQGIKLYYNKYAGYATLERPLSTELPTGGILADEMGLGKTVEVLACVLSHPRPGKFEETTIQQTISKQDSPLEYKSENSLTAVETSASTDSGVVFESDDSELNSEENEEIMDEVQKRDSVDEIIEEVVEQSGRMYGLITSIDRTIEETIARVCSPKKQMSEHRRAAMRWYELELASMSPKACRAPPPVSKGRSDAQRTLCVCGMDKPQSKKIKCPGCSSWQHASCMGSPEAGQYLCPQCWQKRDLIPSRATLIVSPASICDQWVSEVKKHIRDPNFSLLVYKGVKDGYVQPTVLARHHIVITTYETLRSELDYAEASLASHSFRYKRRFLVLASPLECVHWWRLCMDEAQMVEKVTTKTAEMARRLHGHHRWAVTGTPVQRSIDDLLGLLQFLGVEPWSHPLWWREALAKPWARGDDEPLLQVLARVMRRTAMIDAMTQLGLPMLHKETHWLNFSPVEEHFYRCHHSVCDTSLQYTLSHLEMNLDRTLRSLHRHSLAQVMQPLLVLRKACSHPLAARGLKGLSVAALSSNSTLTMEELLESLLKKTVTESEEALRQHIAALNGCAGALLLQKNYSEAVARYREVLRVVAEYPDLKADKLQRIHTMYNLAEVLESSKCPEVGHTLRDGDLRAEALSLETQYLQRSAGDLERARDVLESIDSSWEQLQSSLREAWWAALLDWLGAQDLDTTLLEHCQRSLDKQLARSLPGLALTIEEWLQGIQRDRSAIKGALHQLQETDQEVLTDKASECHLRISPGSMKHQRTKCPLCKCEAMLKSYECKLFAVSSKGAGHAMVGDVMLLGQLNQGTWHPSDMEVVVRAFVSFTRMRTRKMSTVPSSLEQSLNQSSIHLRLLDLQKREFKNLRHLWSLLGDQVAARDELSMSKMRLRLRQPGEVQPEPSRGHNPLKHLSSNLANSQVTLHILDFFQVEGYQKKMESECILSMTELKTKFGQLTYLRNLQQDKNVKECPICKTELQKEWAVLQCGHCYCMSCITVMLERHKGSIQWNTVGISCAMCRVKTLCGELSFINTGEVKYSGVRGSHSTKVTAIVAKLLELRASDPEVKVLVFSTWEIVLDVLEKALEQNNVEYRRLKAGHDGAARLQEFKSKPYITALLLPVKWGAKGLNLTEASHVMFMNPLLNPSDEQQAIGRIYRIGQTRQPVVHHFMVQGTVEEKIHKALSEDVERWRENRVTLQQLRDLM